MPSDRVRIIGRFPNALVHAYDRKRGLIFSSKNRVFAVADLSRPRPVEVGRVSWGPAQWPSHLRLLDRALRHSIQQVAIHHDGRYLVFAGDAWHSINGNGQSVPIPAFSETRPMHRGVCAVPGNGCIYVAGYDPNPRKLPVPIYRTTNLAHFEVAWEFPSREVRHVHAIVQDPAAPETVWVLTGDEDHESSFYRTDDDFKTLTKAYNRGQMTRAVDLVFEQGRAVWGMDSPRTASYVIQAPRGELEKAEQVHELPGPAYYMSRNEAGALYLGTTVELPKTMTYRVGHVLGTRPGGCWEDMLQLKKDWFPQFGIVYFPTGQLPENYLVYSQRALRPYEGHLTIARDAAWG